MTAPILPCGIPTGATAAPVVVVRREPVRWLHWHPTRACARRGDAFVPLPPAPLHRCEPCLMGEGSGA